jgi:CDP-paratose 2-epimerase
MRKVVVTGGAGFIGFHTAQALLKDGCQVTVVDNLSRGRSSQQGNESAGKVHWATLQSLPNVTAVTLDVRDSGALKSMMNDVDAIVHTAGQVAVTSSLINPQEDLEVNLLGTFNLLEAVRKSNSSPRMVFCSTNKVYGNNVNGIPIREFPSRYAYSGTEFEQGISEGFSVDHTQHTPYGTSKLAADLYFQDYAWTYGLKSTVFRMSCIYGENQQGTEDQGWVAHFVRSAVRRRPIQIYGDGKQVRDILHVSDLVRAFKAVLFRGGKSGGEVFNIGGGVENTISLLELVGILGDSVGSSIELRFGPWRDGDQRVYVSDIRKAMRQLDWSPQVVPSAGIARLLEWARTEPSTG